MPDHISNGDWFTVSTADRVAVEAGTKTKASVSATTNKKKD